MESSSHLPLSPIDAAAELQASAAARDAFIRELSLPRGYSLITGLGSAALAYGVALGNSDWRFGSVAFVVALLIEAVVISVAMRSFRARNGAWVTGLSGPTSSRLVVAANMCILAACIVGATALMVGDHPVLSALVALCALPATAISDRWWMARYRAAR